MNCSNCGAENEEKAKFCKSCGLPIVPESEKIQPEVQGDPYPRQPGAAEKYPYPPQAPVRQPSYQEPKPPSQPASGVAIASMVCGICSVVLCATVIFGLGCGIAAICLAASDRGKKGKTGMSTAGLVLGIIGTCLSVFVLFGYIIAGVAVGFWQANGGKFPIDDYNFYNIFS